MFAPAFLDLQLLPQAGSTAAVSGVSNPIESAVTYLLPLILSGQSESENMLRFLSPKLLDWKSVGELALSEQPALDERLSRGQHTFYRTQVGFDASATKQWEEVLERLRVTSPSRPLLQATKKLIRVFADLEENWDSYGAVPITSDTITRALDLVDRLAVILLGHYSDIPEPFVAPCSDGGIQFEWDNDGRELEIVVSPDRLPLRYFHIQGDEEGSGIISPDTQLKSLMDWLVGASS